MAGYYPPVGFHFRVEVLDLAPHKTIENDSRFTEVSGLSVEMATEEVAEGGENRFIQKYPTRTKYSELVLKRGLLTNSEVLKWIRDCIEDYNIQPKNVNVQLLNENHEPLVTWHLSKAYPTKWSVSDLNASNNAVVIETLQLFYQRFTFETA
jgi:phage tail-like protein